MAFVNISAYCFSIVYLVCIALVQGQPLKCYTMERIKTQLNLDRQKLVAYALLAGCDFTTGVPGVGRATAVKLLQQLSGEEAILDRWVILFFVSLKSLVRSNLLCILGCNTMMYIIN